MKKTLSFILFTGLVLLLTACATRLAVEENNENQGGMDHNENVEMPATEPMDEGKEEATEPSAASALQNNTYTNTQYGYSIAIPEGWEYKETTGENFEQAVGFNPSGTSGEDYKALVAVLSIDRQEYLNSLDSNPNLKIDREFGDYVVNGLPASKFVYKNLSTGSTFSIFIISANGKNYVLTPEESVESVFLNSFKLN